MGVTGRSTLAPFPRAHGRCATHRAPNETSTPAVLLFAPVALSQPCSTSPTAPCPNSVALAHDRPRPRAATRSPRASACWSLSLAPSRTAPRQHCFWLPLPHPPCIPPPGRLTVTVSVPLPLRGYPHVIGLLGDAARDSQPRCTTPPGQALLVPVALSHHRLLSPPVVASSPQGICLLVNFACTFSHTKRERELLMRVAIKNYSSA